MKIVIAGGSGFVGHALSSYLLHANHEVIILTRKPSYTDGAIKYVQWLKAGSAPEKQLSNIDAIINLAGTSLNEGRWTKNRKEEIYISRIEATMAINRLIEELPQKPKVLVNASAVGIYPTSKAATYNEASTQQAHDFLGKTVADWESVAKKSQALGVRVVLCRFGVIFGKGGGALPMMVLPYKLHVGGNLGSGLQWVSWVHLDDVARAIDFILHDESISGPVNITSPNPVRMTQIGQTISTILQRKHWFPTPSPLLKIALGEKSMMILEGQRVIPVVLQNSGFEFSYAKIQDALTNLL
ncbi:TIGR01777 family oxidoreductase [Kurthia sibirica]|uniref:TIGR01777 family protein n=1 Tax=Kurthia sibirica TaxID=202750 RepID=A0A2U3AL86_9BACL|nr:TIGR01777 family oxidoreductase [Kurthia sibirica]PWI25298.1 TIGR01777 family protein [Kurthia sibirica]GEK34639.1 epimerase [Kurthia sibirica]